MRFGFMNLRYPSPAMLPDSASQVSRCRMASLGGTERRPRAGCCRSRRPAGWSYRIEVRAPGYEPLTVDVNVEPGRTITYHGDMQPARP